MRRGAVVLQTPWGKGRFALRAARSHARRTNSSESGSKATACYQFHRKA